MNTAEHGNRDITKEESTKQLLQKLELILQREESENEDVEVGLNSSSFQSAWKSYCSAHNLQVEEGIYSLENIHSVLEKLANELKESSIVNIEAEKVKKLVEHYLSFSQNAGITVYVKKGVTEGNYDPEFLIQNINSINIGTIPHSLLGPIVLSGNKVVIRKLADCITKENIGFLDDAFHNILRGIMRATPDKIPHIVNCITSDNLESIYCFTIGLLSNPPSALGNVEGNIDGKFVNEVKKLRDLINTGNRASLDWRTRNYLGDRGKIATILRKLVS